MNSVSVTVAALQYYLGPSVSARAFALIGSLIAGDYDQRPTLFDPRSVVRELWSGVIRQQSSKSGKVSAR